MLDLARYQLANLSNGGSIQPIEIPNVVDPLAVPSHIEISVPEVSLHDSPCGLAMPTKRSSEVSTDISEFIDVFFEKDDWAVNKESAANEVSDDGSDHLDFILENDFWLDEENTEAIVSAQPTLAPQPRVQVVSPVLSLNLKSSNEQVPPNLSRKEKNRIHARNRRMKLKMEHAKLKQSVDAFTQCTFRLYLEWLYFFQCNFLHPYASLAIVANALLKKKNKELELMLLKAHSYVAGATKGYQHYSTVFADGAACIHSARCGKEKYSDAAPAFDDVAHRSSVLGELDDDDDNHSLSFLWN